MIIVKKPKEQNKLIYKVKNDASDLEQDFAKQKGKPQIITKSLWNFHLTAMIFVKFTCS